MKTPSSVLRSAFARSSRRGPSIERLEERTLLASSVFELASLLPENGGNGTSGFVLNGVQTADGSGLSVSSAGDVNGDGFDDVIIGALATLRNGDRFVGEAYVVFGKQGGFAASDSLSNLNGTNGFVIGGNDVEDYSGRAVSSAGDVNGDGFDDLIIGATGGDPNGVGEAGETYVIFGKAGGFASRLSLSSLNGSNGFVLNGINTGDKSGSAVSSAGDVNGDGFGDLIIGTYAASPGGNEAAGESYVVFGKASGFTASFDLASLDGTSGFVVSGIDTGDQSGGSVSSAGDINGDGFDDVIIGAPGGDPKGVEDAGESYVIFGKASGFATNLNLSSLDGSNGFVINGIGRANYVGISVSTAGDMNGDGFDDLIIGASSLPPFEADADLGNSYIVFGKANGFAASLDLSSINGRNGFALSGAGFSVSAAGDVNRDGFADVIVGTPAADPNGMTDAGEAYVIFGKAGGYDLSMSLLNINGQNGFAISGIYEGDYAGLAVSSAGDVNGDGFDDLVVGAFGADPNGNEVSGQTYVVFGSDSSEPCDPIAGDWDGDGDTDMAIFRAGTWYLDSNGTPGWQASDTTLSFGVAIDRPVVGDWDGNGIDDVGVFRDGTWYLDSNGTPGWQWNDTVINFGVAIDQPIAGDWNNDGVDTIGVYRGGAWYLDTNGTPGWQWNDTATLLGVASDIPLVGDWDGNGDDNLGVLRGRTWYLDTNSSLGWQWNDTAINYGVGYPVDVPVVGDWDGTGDDNLGVVRSVNNVWYLDSNGQLGFQGTDVGTRFNIPRSIVPPGVAAASANRAVANAVAPSAALLADLALTASTRSEMNESNEDRSSDRDTSDEALNDDSGELDRLVDLVI